MLKKTCLLLLILNPLFFSCNRQDKSTIFLVDAGVLNVRDEPAVSGNIIKQLKKNDKVTVTNYTWMTETIQGVHGTWVEVEVSRHKKGYVFDAYLKKLYPTKEDLNRIYTDGIKNPGDYGVIKGMLSFPSEGIPEILEVCAFSLSTSKIYCTKKRFHEKDRYIDKYQIFVPGGQYYVYEYIPYSQSFRSYYTSYSKCGFDDKCPHEKIKVVIKKGQLIDNIDPGDCYFKWQPDY